MNLDEAIKPDRMRSLVKDVFKVVAGAAFRGVLYVVAVGALCLASIIRVMGLWTAPGTGALTLAMLATMAFIAGWALRRAERYRDRLYEPQFCALHRPTDRSSPPPADADDWLRHRLGREF